MPRCAQVKPNGDPCERIVPASQGYCYSHDPERAEQRRRAASRAGRSKPSRDVADVKRRLSELADGVLDGSVDKSVGAVASQVLNVYLRAVSVELKVREVQEIEQRLEELEALLVQKKEAKNWG